MATLKIKAEEMGKSLENLDQVVEGELRQAVSDVATAAYNSMVAQVQSMSADPKNRQDYLRGLNYTQIDQENFLIFLDGDWANKLEQGFGPYSIKEKLLDSDKRVEVGSRAGEKWVRQGKNGRYAAVPFEKKPFSGEKSGNLAQDIKKLVAKNRQGKEQKLTKTFKDEFGNPLAGKVARVGEVRENPSLSGLTKFQYVNPSGRVSSVYMTFRTVSDKSSGWQHPGFEGYNLFKQVEEYVESELENIVNTLL